MTDSEWDEIRDLIPEPKIGPEDTKYERREIVNAIRYKLRTGCQWRYLPHDFPPWKSVSQYFYAWQDNGTWKRINDELRVRVRKAAGRHEAPSLGMLDSQSTKTTEAGGLKGYDGGKKIKGRKRHILVDILGMILALMVTAASILDRDVVPQMLAQGRAQSSRLEKVLVDRVYKGEVVDKASQETGIVVEVRSRPAESSGFVPIPLRWTVERSFGWMNRWRELSKEYTRNPKSSEAWIHVGFIGLMTHRLAEVRHDPCVAGFS